MEDVLGEDERCMCVCVWRVSSYITACGSGELHVRRCSAIMQFNHAIAAANPNISVCHYIFGLNHVCNYARACACMHAAKNIAYSFE